MDDNSIRALVTLTVLLAIAMSLRSWFALKKNGVNAIYRNAAKLMLWGAVINMVAYNFDNFMLLIASILSAALLLSASVLFYYSMKPNR